MSGGLGKDTFTEMFDMEIARKATFGGHNSIATLLYKSTEKLIDARFETGTEQLELKPLRPVEKSPIDLKGEQPLPLPQRSSQPINISHKVELLPLQRRTQATNDDPIMARFGSLIEAAARENKLDSALISSVIRAESNGNPDAVSPAGAKGLMQLIDSTAQDLNVRDVFDPHENIRAGSRYLRQMLDRFGDLKLALAAYNAGPGNVEKHGGVPPFEETRTYVRRVTDYLAAQSAK
ncbi:MAG: transglycosylase SLT domain-containing protein [candidate division Zixibacteria bacterium]|nr:transglycosylase SLT domain-containing protein [candidate division Zixibacteria bacterium]